MKNIYYSATNLLSLKYLCF